MSAAIGTKIKPRKWLKKHESQACDDKLKLKVVILHDGSKEFLMTQPDWFAAEDSVTSSMELISMNYSWLDSLR